MADAPEPNTSDFTKKALLAGGVVAAAVAAFVASQYFLKSSTSSDPQDHFEVLLKLKGKRASSQRSAPGAASSSSSSSSSGADNVFEYDWDIVLGSDYFYSTRPTVQGHLITRVFLLGGPKAGTVIEYSHQAGTFCELPAIFDLDQRIQSTMKLTQIMDVVKAHPDIATKKGFPVHAWAPLELQTTNGFIPDELLSGTQRPGLKGNLFGGLIQMAHIDEFTPRTALSEHHPLPRPTSCIAYSWAETQEEVVDYEPLSESELQEVAESFTPHHVNTWKVAFAWLFRIHPEIANHILQESHGLPASSLWFRSYTTSNLGANMIFESVHLEECSTRDSSPGFVPPASIAQFKGLAGPDRVFGPWLEQIQSNWHPVPVETKQSELQSFIDAARNQPSDKTCFEALLAIQEFVLQCSMPEEQNHPLLEELMTLTTAEYTFASAYIDISTNIIFGSAGQIQLGPGDIERMQDGLERLSRFPSPLVPILNYWKANISADPKKLIGHFIEMLNFNPYLVAAWINLGDAFHESENFVEAWLSWAMAERLDPHKSHRTWATSKQPTLQQEITKRTARYRLP